MTLNNYDRYLVELLKEPRSFFVIEELVTELKQQFGVTDVNAKKIVQRAVSKKIIKSSSPVTFGKGRHIYFGLKSILDKDAILKVAKLHRPPLYRLLSLLDINGGIISFFEGLKVTASPLEKSSTKVSNLKDLLQTLIDLYIVEEKNRNGIKYYVYSNIDEESLNTKINKYYQSMVIDSMFLPDILRWLQKHNLIDNSNVVFRNRKQPQFGAVHNNLAWDAFAYTSTTGIHNKFEESNENKKTLIVLDAVLSRDYTEIDLQGFYERIQIIRNAVKIGVRKILPIVVLKNETGSIVSSIHKLGFLSLGVGTIYGEKIYEIISNLQFIKNQELVKMDDSELFVEAIGNILADLRQAGQELNLQNIKGDLFESLMYPLISMIYTNSTIEPGRVLRKNDPTGKKEYYEYDYIITSSNQREFIIFELKGYKSTNIIKLGDTDTKNTIRWFFRRTLPFAQKALKNDIFSYPIKGCYITTAKFEEDTIQVLEEINKSILKPNLLDVYYDGKKLANLLEQTGLKKIIEIIDKYYYEKIK